ncbi:unnamed protein product [Rotaria sordida]|uniref:Cysteine--tRNA ligase, cytoplasmic n=1 Tax=Rotaria sordida TaxID=392033 RepID=A0A814R3X5_9BILA|nr:unnamed protein product [Rotaria sordida]CAF1127947.1 unnamed protein product [Rotaria sordida]CAF3676440.1 unnamed protein product [Rotaria sordida]CAF3893442.1 unnamed protein product [Rotaria sordida]
MSSTTQQKSSSTMWKCPEMVSEARLRLYNSFTKKKELFVPINGNEVRWYSCGPTVYDTSHMGHARSYISFDILRRVMADYFGYDVLYCMNVTDIDDKIIKRARERYLIKNYMDDSSIAIEKVLEDCQLALKHVKDIRARETDKDKQAMYDKQISTVENSLQNINTLSDMEAKRKKLFDDCRDILPTYLDFNYSHATNPLDNEVFLTLARHYESEFHNDMSHLNILPPHILTRVSEYVPEIIKFIEKIIENGYAYESNSSVYFETMKFHKQHSYAKLEPDRMGDINALSEGEGALTTASNTSKEKRNECDFVLWKKSKIGEPVWQSPWGLGRPGWHIECSVMASTILGSQFDIHTGGIDLKFPHHDNEIAQAEAYYDSDTWVNYFLHSGHLTIAGCKMSKSLKNFVTIQQALEKYTSRQIRLLFLLHSWASTLDYSDHGMEKTLNYEKMLNEFFLNIKTHLRSMKQLNHSNAYTKFDENDLQLNERFSTAKKQIHIALCDSIDTPTVMENIRQLITTTNIYMNRTNAIINRLLLRNIAVYITRLIDIFGLNSSGSSSSSTDNIGFTRSSEQQQASSINVEDIAMPYVEQFALFRDAVRTQAITVKNKEILTLCDHVRNEILPELGVRLEDHAGTNKATIKFCDPEILRREREQALLVEKSKQEEKERRKLEQQLAKEAKEAKKKAPKEKKNTDSKNSTQPTNDEIVTDGATAMADGDALSSH